MAENFGSAANVSVVEYSLRELGDVIVVSGSLNTVETSGAIAQRQVHWLMVVSDGKIAAAESFLRREDAMAAARAVAGGAAG
jgi:ketosteroid isomerase-like protein